MSAHLLHPFSRDEQQRWPLPTSLNNPFHDAPHPLCLVAMRHVMQAIAADAVQRAWFEQGKMLGVLVVRCGRSVAFLAAYSGQFELGSLDYFVPPVFDLSKPHGFYLAKDQEISALNEEIAHLEQDAAYVELCKVREEYKVQSQAQIEAYKTEIQAAKVQRDLLRAEATMALDGSDKMRIASLKPQIDLNRLIQESQFQKAELRRLKTAQKVQLEAYDINIERHQEQIAALKRERKERSEALQREIFEHFRFHNGRGEERSLMEIFRTYSPTPLPPAGAGECAGPRLLEYALRHGWQPLSMAEFWYGHPTRDSNRKHGCCYPPCQEKCAPIMGFMLEGLAVTEVASAVREVGTETPLEVLYEDDSLMVVDKPGGVLSVPGRGAHPYVLQLLQRTHPEALSYAPVHRLDMDTSGLLLVAKSAWAHRALQRLFIERKVEKRYQAWLEGEVLTSCGIIRLPLSPDPYHRPRQRVDCEMGKCALSYYEVLRYVDGRTLVSFMPLTGRTHQLRLHASAGEGLHTPIVGDPLYGAQCHITHEQLQHPSQANTPEHTHKHEPGHTCEHEPLLLHACYLKLIHPFTGKVIEVEKLRW